MESAGCTFPIDAVYTWVDGSDPDWRAVFDRHVSPGRDAGLAHPSAAAATRFHDRDELRYSLRSLERFAPYIRRVFLITADQRPEWLADHADLTLVSHRDLFPDASHLPTFNSHAIEAHLHRIEGLAEHFLYLNDDFLLSSPSRPEDFFDAYGRSVVYVDHRDVAWDPLDPRYDEPAQCAARNNSRWLEERYGLRIRNRIDHAPYALRRSVLEEIWQWIPEALDATSGHRVRHPDDISLASSFAPWFAACTGRAILETDPHATYIKLKNTFRKRLKARLRMRLYRHLPSRRGRFLSVNDCGALDESASTERAVRRLFDALFRGASRFERTPPAGARRARRADQRLTCPASV
jgi:hypothetical protein